MQGSCQEQCQCYSSRCCCWLLLLLPLCPTCSQVMATRSLNARTANVLCTGRPRRAPALQLALFGRLASGDQLHSAGALGEVVVEADAPSAREAVELALRALVDALRALLSLPLAPSENGWHPGRLAGEEDGALLRFLPAPDLSLELMECAPGSGSRRMEMPSSSDMARIVPLRGGLSPIGGRSPPPVSSAAV